MRECAGVGVIKMGVREEDDVYPRQLVDAERGRGQPFRADSEKKWNPDPDTRKEHRIGKNVDAKKIDEHGGMAEPRNSDTLVAPLSRIRPGDRRPDPPETFDR